MLMLRTVFSEELNDQVCHDFVKEDTYILERFKFCTLPRKITRIF